MSNRLSIGGYQARGRLCPGTRIVGLGVWLALHMAGCSGAPGADTLTPGLEALRLRAERVAAAAAAFDPSRPEHYLSNGPYNGPHVYLEQLLDSATYEGRGTPWETGPPTVLDLQLDGSDSHQLVLAGAGAAPPSPQSRFVVADGRLVVYSLQGDVLTTGDVLRIAKDTVGEIRIRLRTRKGRYFRVGFGLDSSQSALLEVDVVPDGELHTYRIDVADTLQGVEGDTIRSLILAPWHMVGDVAEVEFVRLVERRSRYSQQPLGVTHVARDGDLRRSLYLQAPGDVTFSLPSLADEPQTLEFGASALEATEPVVVRVVLDRGQQAVEVDRLVVSSSRVWTDRLVELPPGDPQPWKLRFEVDAPPGSVVFLSDPVIRTRPRQRLNIIVVLEDALRRDRGASPVGGHPTAPFRDQLADSGVRFTCAVAQATKTRPSCPSIMTSLYPTATGVWNFRQRLADSYLTLAEILRLQGFETASFIQNANAGPEAGLHQGFRSLFTVLPGRAPEIFGAVIDWVDRQGGDNFFAYVHVLDPHGPYDPPPSHRGWYREARDDTAPALQRDEVLFDPAWVEVPHPAGRRALYDGEVRFNDDAMRAFVNALVERDLYDSTLIVLLSDHGEFLGEWGLWGHQPPGYDAVLRVPLVMHYPRGVGGGRVVDVPVQNVDVMPTILELAGVGWTGLPMHGDSLVPLLRGQADASWSRRPVYSEEVMRKSSRADRRPFASIYLGTSHFLSTLADPVIRFDTDQGAAESRGRDVSQKEHDQIQRCIRSVQDANATVREHFANNRIDEVVVDPRSDAQLRALGYIE